MTGSASDIGCLPSWARESAPFLILASLCTSLWKRDWPDTFVEVLLQSALTGIWTMALSKIYDWCFKRNPFMEYFQVDWHYVDDCKLKLRTMDNMKVSDVLQSTDLCDELQRAADQRRDGMLRFVTMPLEKHGTFWKREGMPNLAWMVLNQVLKHLSTYSRSGFLAKRSEVRHWFAIISDDKQRGGAAFRILLISDEDLGKMRGQEYLTRLKEDEWKDKKHDLNDDYTNFQFQVSLTKEATARSSVLHIDDSTPRSPGTGSLGAVGDDISIESIAGEEANKIKSFPTGASLEVENPLRFTHPHSTKVKTKLKKVAPVDIRNQITVFDKHRNALTWEQALRNTYGPDSFPLDVVRSSAGQPAVTTDNPNHHRRLLHMQEMARALSDKYDGVLVEKFAKKGLKQKWMQQIDLVP